MDDVFLTHEESVHGEAFNARLRACNIRFVDTVLEKQQKCHACGSTSSESLMTCTGCSSIFFCNKECQIASWSKHSQSCPRHDRIGMKGIQFMPTLYGLVSLQHHPLFTKATDIVETEDGFPMACHKVEPGRSFGEVLKGITGTSFVIVDSSLYAQLVILAMNWSPVSDRFVIFVGNKPVGSQLDIYNMPNSHAILLRPTNREILQIYAKQGEDSPLDHFQGPRPMELVYDGKSKFRGMMRFQGPIRGTPEDIASFATSELSYWVDMVGKSDNPVTFGTETTWTLNQDFALLLSAFTTTGIKWTCETAKRPSDETESEPEETGEVDHARNLPGFEEAFPAEDE